MHWLRRIDYNGRRGCNEFCVISYRLWHSPEFECLISYALKDMLGQFVIAYMDDMLIIRFLTSVTLLASLNTSSRLNYLLKVSICQFHPPMKWILMDQTNVIAGTAWSTPVTVKELQHFFKFANFNFNFSQANHLMPSLSGSLLHTFPVLSLSLSLTDLIQTRLYVLHAGCMMPQGKPLLENCDLS